MLSFSFSEAGAVVSLWVVAAVVVTLLPVVPLLSSPLKDTAPASCSSSAVGSVAAVLDAVEEVISDTVVLSDAAVVAVSGGVELSGAAVVAVCGTVLSGAAVADVLFSCESAAAVVLLSRISEDAPAEAEAPSLFDSF